MAMTIVILVLICCALGIALWLKRGDLAREKNSANTLRKEIDNFQRRAEGVIRLAFENLGQYLGEGSFALDTKSDAILSNGERSAFSIVRIAGGNRVEIAVIEILWRKAIPGVSYSLQDKIEFYGDVFSLREAVEKCVAGIKEKGL